MLNASVIRSILLNHGFNDDEYLVKYCDLILANEYTEAKEHVTNVHHVIPKHVHKSVGWKQDDSKFNKVNLSYSDHILAHYYLMMCGGEHTKRNEKALKILTAGTRGNMTILEAVDNRDYLQDVYTQTMTKVSNLKALERLRRHQEKVSLHD